MTRDWNAVLDIVAGAGLTNGEDLVATAISRRMSPETVLDGFRRAIELSENLVDGEEHPFSHYESTPPAMIDLRVLAQGEVWVDVLRIPHTIHDPDFTDSYLMNLIRHLEREATAYWPHYDPTPEEADPAVWIESTVLMQSLRNEAALRGMTPEP
ncbi:hypothetical protein ACPPVQ_05915 [Diaminobutyricibacter sp. McL0618]|uniref:hypothetical protein n=1 Tax=Leifsonia sp. McL0618 TaxID=3415677 RepID=UPI003CF474A5